MKRFMLVILILVSIQVSFGQKSDFYDEILNFEACTNCYFIVFDIESKVYDGKIAIENDDLFGFLNKTKGFSSKEYKEFVRDLISNKKKLYVENALLGGYDFFVNVKDVSENKFRIIKDDDEIDKVALKGCNTFISYYFLEMPLEDVDSSTSNNCKEFIGSRKEKLLLRKSIRGIREQNSIINYLYKWQIPTRIDDISNSLIIDKKIVKNLSNVDMKYNDR